MVSRRSFIQRVGAAGGYPAAYATMQALGFIRPAAASAGGPPDLAAGGGGRGAKVAILGAGVAGMAAAYELGRAGYDCTILEARRRVGGRNWTVRRGDVVELTDGSRQVCDFDKGQYFNAGPARLPSHHQAVLGYCRELDVDLEPEINTSRSALLLNPNANGGRPIQLRQAVNDTRGHVSELLAKAVNRGALDDQLAASDKQRIVAFLKTYGDLNPDLFYRGSTRAGYKTAPGAGDERGSARDPLDLGLLLDEDMWAGVLFEEVIDMQATMFQPKGGMDHIPAAFARALGPVIRRGCEVREVRKTSKGVTIAYRDVERGADAMLEAAYCICTIPLPVLRKIDCDFSPAFREAIARAPYGDAIKIAWQAPRFWEGPTYQIYGGISFVKSPNSLIWYPSHGMHSKTGVLLGAYATGPAAVQMGAMSRAAQIEFTRKVIDQLHPGSGALLEKPVQVQWSLMPYNLGPWVQWPTDHEPDYSLLSQPDGPIYFAGEYLSHVGAWQEGAIRSAHRTVALLDAAHRQGQPVAATRAQ
ncbi:MAG: flavin monoamine oxidase family protein [Caulobacterales bacterium]